MENRTAAVIITILAVLLCGCPGLAALCFGIASLVDYAGGFGILSTDARSYTAIISSGLCGGVILIIIAVLVSYFVLRQKKVSPTPPPPPATPQEPLPPTI